MNEIRSISDTARLVDELRTAATRLGEEQRALEKETRQRKEALQMKLAAELQRLRAEQLSSAEKIRTDFHREQLVLDEKKERRAKRITQAHDAVQKRELGKLDEMERRRTFHAQKGILETEKARDKRLAELKQQSKDFSEDTEAQRLRLEKLRRRVTGAFSSYPWFRGYLRQDSAKPITRAAGNPAEMLSELHELEKQTVAALGSFQARILPVFFRFLPIWLCVLIGTGLYLAGPERISFNISPGQFHQWIAIGLGGAVFLYILGWFISRPAAHRAATLLVQWDDSLRDGVITANSVYSHDNEETLRSAEDRIAAHHRDWESAIAEAGQGRADLDQNLERRWNAAQARNERLHDSRVDGLRARYDELASARENEAIHINTGIEAATQGKLRELKSAYNNQRQKIEAEWEAVASGARTAFEEARLFGEEHFPGWNGVASYDPPSSALNVLKLGEVDVEVSSPLDATGNTLTKFGNPLLIRLPGEGMVLIESDNTSREKPIRSLNSLAYRVLQSTPPGKAVFTFIDPIRLGESFSSIMHLADFEESLVNRRIWTEPAEIEERLLELNAHMEKVIQMYLRNEFSSIVEYNQAAGATAEKYHFLVVADFPAHFSETALRRLVKILTTGARCGVFAFLHWNKSLPLLPGFEMQALVEASLHIESSRQTIIPRLGTNGVAIELDDPPQPEIATRFLQQVGEAARGSNAVQVPFSQVTPNEAGLWSLDTTDELRVPVGRSGANKLQYLSLGKGTRQHVLIAGKTGSGKSTLLHVIITNLALWASPEQVEFYLVDFKKGVEFKDYAVANLPHARVVAIESDREFGLSVLQRVDEELRNRGEMFRSQGAQDLGGFKRASGQSMSRVLLIIDEFQELFVEDDATAQNAALLLDRIVRQGRAFGIHVILGTQTLGGSYSLARSTLGQMVVRVALQCNESDASLIMEDNNPAPRLLSRPGEGIYNDSGGRIEANSPFQVVWLSEAERREALRTVQLLSEQAGTRAETFVFEGNSPADLAANSELQTALDSDSTGLGTIWLGVPNKIKGPTKATLDARSGRNLLIAGQQDDYASAMLTAVMLSLAAQNDTASARFILLQPLLRKSQELEAIAKALPHETEIPSPSDLGDFLRGLVEELESRENGKPGPGVYLIVRNLSGLKALRPDDEFSISLDQPENSPARDFQRIYTDGPVHGIHVIAHIDNFTNANRFLGRRGLKEFSLRVLFQMSASDSASFCDDPCASNLGLNRAVFYDEEEATYETFRPYARPNDFWLRRFFEKLENRISAPPAEFAEK